MNNRNLQFALGAIFAAALAIGCAPATSPSEGSSAQNQDDSTQVASNSLSNPDNPDVSVSSSTPPGADDAKEETQATGKESTTEPKASAPTAARPQAIAPAGPGGQGGPGGGFGRGGGMAFFLANDQIKKELAITADQEKKLQALMPQRGTGGPGGGQGAPNTGQQMSPEERQKQREEAQKKVDAILTAAQKARIQQIQYQMMGSRAFTNDDVAIELGLSAEQTKQLEALRPQRGQGGQGGGAVQPTPEERQKLREERIAKSLAILTPAQKAKWEKMKGKPFEFQRANQAR